MPRGSPALKLAITVDREVHAKVLRAATEEHVSVSAWMTAAARRVLMIHEGLAAVDAWEAEHGRFSIEEIEAGRARIRRPGKRTVKARTRATRSRGR